MYFSWQKIINCKIRKLKYRENLYNYSYYSYPINVCDYLESRVKIYSYWKNIDTVLRDNWSIFIHIYFHPLNSLTRGQDGHESVTSVKSSKFNLYKCSRKQIWPCLFKGQGQPKVIIWTNLEVLEYPMLYTGFQGHHFVDSGEKIL